MAIRRCPYCKAIIDEQDKYCNNCGTQLLFPEDEFVEEEIPGDKIIDDEEAEGEETEKKEPGEEPELEAELEEEEEEDGEEEEDKIEPEELLPDDDDEAGDKKHTHELEEPAAELEEEAEAGTTGEVTGALAADLGSGAGTAGKVEDLPEEEAGELAVEELAVEEKEEEEEKLEEEEEVEEEVLEEEPGTAELEEPDQDGGKKYEVSLEEDELVFRTKEMTGPAPTTDEAPAKTGRLPDTGSLPPWASRIRETPAAVEPEDETRAEPKSISREWTTDSGIGIPEKITQAPLPFGDTGEQNRQTPGQEKDQVEEETEEAVAEEGPGGQVSLSMKLRAKLVDWVFVTALWVISLWFTAQVVGVSFFRLIFGSPLPVLAFYAILLILYFFLFLYFLGETLGDHYFSE